MGDRINNVKTLFTDTRTRVIVIVTAFLLILAIVAGYLGLRRTTTEPTAGAVIPTQGTGISAVPGSLNPTAQYAKLQAKQNIQQAKRALKTGESALPTVIRLQRVGTGQQIQRDGGVGFKKLAQLQAGGIRKQLWFQDIKKADCSPASIQAALKQGAQPKDLLTTGCSAQQLIAAKITADQLRSDGVGAQALRQAGFSGCDLKAAGFTAKQLHDAGFTDDELKGAGYSPAQIAAATGGTDQLTPEQIRNAGCSAAALSRERANGVSASQIRRYANCSAAALKAAGFTAKQLRAAGYTAKELKDAGFSAADLSKAGFTPKQLLNAGFTPADLKQAGISAAAIKAAQAQKDLPNGLTADDLRKAGCGVDALKRERAKGVSAGQIRRIVGCTAAQLKAAGYTARELKDAGFTTQQLKDAGFSPAQLKRAGATAKQLKNAGFTAEQLKKANFGPAALKNAGFSADALKQAGYSAKQLKDAGFTPSELKNAGFSASALKQAGLSAKQLQAAGFSPADLKDAGLSARALTDAGLTPDQLRNAGFTDNELQDQGVIQADTPTTQARGTAEAQQLNRILQQQAAQVSDQQTAQDISQRNSQMSRQANALIGAWHTTSTQRYTVGSPPKTDQEKASQTGAAGGAQGAAGEAGGRPAMIKAGDIMFAVLDTAVNSDEPGPVLAHIVTGPYKGAKLIGSIRRPANAKRVILSFNVMSWPNYPHTIRINAVAMDQNTARIALSSHTNNHYLLRYGSLFASSFLEGVGDAIRTEATRVELNATSTTFQGKNLNGGEIAMIGGGKLGQRWGQQIAPIFNKPPTVKVYSGTGIGIFFSSDVPQLPGFPVPKTHSNH